MTDQELTELASFVGPLAEHLRTQDNACTAHPQFVVQQRRRIFGFDPQWTEDIGWTDADGEASKEESARLEAHYQETGEEEDGWTRSGYVDTWEPVQWFFTRRAAELHIAQRGHAMTDSRVWVDSAYRNHEWQGVVKLLLAGPALLAELRELRSDRDRLREALRWLVVYVLDPRDTSDDIRRQLVQDARMQLVIHADKTELVDHVEAARSALAATNGDAE